MLRIMGQGIKTSCRLAAWAVLAVLSSLHMPLAAQGKPPSPMAACGAANKQAFAELVQAHAAELRRHALHPVLVSRLQGLGGRFSGLRSATARPPRNPAECEKLQLDLADAREQLWRIAGSPEQVGECVLANRHSYTQVQTTLLELQTGSKAPTLDLEKAAGRLDQLRAGLANDTPALADCRGLGAELASVRAEVQRLVPPPPPPPPPPVAASTPEQLATACRRRHARAYNEVAQAYAKLVGRGNLPAEVITPLQVLSDRLKSLHVTIADPAAPGWECNSVSRALAQAGGEIEQLARR